MSSTCPPGKRKLIMQPITKLSEVFAQNRIQNYEVQEFRKGVLSRVVVVTTPSKTVYEKQNEILALFKKEFPAITITRDTEMAILAWARDKMKDSYKYQKRKAGGDGPSVAAGDIFPGLMLAVEYNIPDNEDNEVADVVVGIMSSNAEEVAAARDRMIVNCEGLRLDNPEIRLLRLGSRLQWDYFATNPPRDPEERVERLATLARSIFTLNWLSECTIARRMLATMKMESLVQPLIAKLQSKPKFEMYLASAVEVIRFLATGEGEIRKLLEAIKRVWEEHE